MRKPMVHEFMSLDGVVQAPGDPFGDLMNAPKKYVMSRTLKTPIWRNTTIIRNNVVEAVWSLKAQPAGTS
jgi:hypothetical protein